MPTSPSLLSRRVWAAATLAALAAGAFAQQAAEEPFWAKGRPKTDTAMKMAPVPAFPIPTAADKLPIAKMKLPPGFKAEVWASDVLDARGLRQGDKGTVFVANRNLSNVYAIVDAGGKREVKTLLKGQKVPNGESSMWGDYHLRELGLYLQRVLDGGPYLTFWS